MSKKDERNLNITIKSQQDDEDAVVISFSDIFRKLKKYFTLWLVAAIIAGVIGVAFGTVHTVVTKPELNALVSFTFKGIEKGLDPKGNTFEVDSMKNPIVIERALTSLGMGVEELDDIRNNLTIKSHIPSDAIDKITVYKSVYETANSGNLAAAQAMLDVTFYPTHYTVSFDYGETSLSRSESVQVLNAILEEYRNYFYEVYGFNESLGTAVPAVDYNSYDYAEQVDLFGDTLTTVEKYLKDLANDDTNLFRSTVTGYTFNDLYRAAQTIDSIDRDRISSLISVNNITKDKAASIAYYDYRIDNLTRSSTALKERLDTIEDSIEKYEKDTILIFGNGTDGNDTSYSQASEEYDKLINQRVTTSTDLADTKQKIEFYKARKSALQSNKTGSKAMMETVEEQLTSLGEKVTDLVQKTELTAQEYYENVEYKNAYNILVPAVASATSLISTIIHNSMVPVFALEALIFFIYFVVSFFTSLKTTSQRRKAAHAGSTGSDDDDDDEADIDDVLDVIEEAVEKKSEKKSKRSE
ncbi:MAG: lipopolysaccharide biosynthesis protein [Ruminococcus sp.]|nr:lipopolysaccharide biosynthesis protein [Ruminococcus sp.]